ncbi:MAG TPA: redoxin domain-containing protein [Candidatus Eremiobacteraceae bacterium]|nr:redoxin domain-containing protein [Candidatus Eremiobacteraceae bacterium]
MMPLAAVTLTALVSAATALAPALNAPDWINGRVTAAQVSGKVVLLDFYTFDCINCKHTEPNLRSLYGSTSRSDLVILSVHSPETPYEHQRANLLASLVDQGIKWPVIVDNDFAVWNAFGVNAWPTQMIFDRRGVLRNTIVGEGSDSELNSEVAKLIAQP